MAFVFNGSTRVITLTPGTTSMSVRDLWSRWVDWLLTGDNSKHQIALTNVGGDDISLADGTKIPIYSFLNNGWRIRPQESNHTLNVVDGILLVSGGGDPFVNTLGTFTVRINYQQPVQAISFSSGGGGGGGGDTKEAIYEYFTQGNRQDVFKADLTAIAAELADLDISITTIQTIITELRKYSLNRWRIVGNQFIVYDDNGTTPLRSFNLRDASGNPTMINPMERTPI